MEKVLRVLSLRSPDVEEGRKAQAVIDFSYKFENKHGECEMRY